MPASMNKNAASLSREDWVKLILGLTLLLGGLVRIFPALLVGFPLNDGGMFLLMIRELRLNGFLLPEFTSYNFAGIPFAYPPAGFYLAGILSQLGMPELAVMRWLPILLNLASIPAFFVLSRALIKDTPRAALATLVYSMVPGNYTWQIMGGGVTRSLGILFILLALHQVFQMCENGRWKHAWYSALFCSLAALSHPEVSLATAGTCVLFWLFFGRTRKSFLQSIVVGVGTMILTAPWWGTVLVQHGVAPFQAVIHSGAYNTNPFSVLISELFTFDAWTGLFHALFLIGLSWSLYKRQYFLPIWMIFPYLTEPRSATAFAYFPQSILAALAMVDAIPAGIRYLRNRSLAESPPPEFFQQRGANAAILTLMLVWFIQSSLYGFRIANTSLRPPVPQQMMAWVNSNTAEQSSFIILTGREGIMTDPIQEWFPALAVRTSHSTLQGLEWVLGEQFFPRLEKLIALQECTRVQCVETWAAEAGLHFSHILIEKNIKTAPLVEALNANADYSIIFDEEPYIIFER